MKAYDCSKENCEEIIAGYTWFCLTDIDPELDLNDVKNFPTIQSHATNCLIKSTATPHSPCGDPDNNKLTSTTNKTNPSILCKGGDVINFTERTVKCPQDKPDCNQNQYTWQCQFGDVKISCKSSNIKSTTTPTVQIPATAVKAAPTGLKLKVGQSQNITVILTPNNSTDAINISTTKADLVKVEKIEIDCAQEGNCNESTNINRYKVTALKAGDVKIKFTANSNTYTEATVAIVDGPKTNGKCGSVKYADLTTTSDKDIPEKLCLTGEVSNFGKMTPNCSNPDNSVSCPPSFYSWECQGSNGGVSVKCSVKDTTLTKISATSIKAIPSSLSLKVGERKNLTYSLTPNKSLDTVKWGVINKGLVRLRVIYPKCSNGSTGLKCVTATKRPKLEITAIKAGTLYITLTTQNGVKTQAKVVITK